MTPPALRSAIALAVALTLGLAPGARAFQAWGPVSGGEVGTAAFTPGPSEGLGLIRKAGRALESFATVGSGDGTYGLSPWLGTGVQWKPAPGWKLSFEGRALLPAPSLVGDIGSGLTGGITVHFIGW